ININDLDRKNNIGIFDISVRHEDPALATRIANEIASVTVKKNAKKKSLEASKSLEFLHYQLPTVKQSLEVAEMKLNRYRAQSGKLDIKLQTENFLRQLAELDKKLAELRISKIDMLQRYTEEHPAFIALSRQIQEIKEDKKNLEYKLKTIPEADQIAVNLMLDAQIKTALYTALLNKIQELEVLKAGTISDVQILSSAKLPDEPLPSKKKLIYLGSILLGLIFSFMLIFVRKLLFIRITDPHWTEHHFNIMNLAIIPYSKEQHNNTFGLTSKKALPLLAQINPRSLSIESLRSLRTSLQVSLTCASNNVISILGIAPGVGKTFVSTNLAYLLATTGKRVLIVDADLRRGTVHKYFNQTASLGFAELISGTKTISEVLKPSSHSNLTVLTRGDYPVDPSELLTSTRCKELIMDFSKQYDVVIIDTAPVLMVTDAVVVSAISATNYLVLGSNVHQPSEIEIVIKRLTNAGVLLNGSIFNFHNSASCKNSYYSKYYGYQSYYEDETEEKQKKKKRKISVN
ncbi:MAG: polysaccharide biosynthesis tyrosine autokinase, partial [Legionella sp.]